MVRSKDVSTIVARAVIMVILAATALLCILPLVNTVAVSFSDKARASAGQVSLLPVGATLTSYDTLLTDLRFFRAFGISVERVVLGLAISMFFTIVMAFPLSRDVKAFRPRNIYMWLMVFTMLFSGGLIPWYMTIRKLRIMDTIWALVLPGAVPVFYIILVMNFFRGIPRELEEAAVIDGANPLQILWRVFLPVSLPSIATVALFTAVGHWNAFFDGLILMNRPENYPLQTYIQTLVVQLNLLTIKSEEDVKRAMMISNRTLNAAKIVVSMIPILAIYPFVQRYFIQGIVLGSVKE